MTTFVVGDHEPRRFAQWNGRCGNPGCLLAISEGTAIRFSHVLNSWVHDREQCAPRAIEVEPGVYLAQRVQRCHLCPELIRPDDRIVRTGRRWVHEGHMHGVLTLTG